MHPSPHGCFEPQCVQHALPGHIAGAGAGPRLNGAGGFAHAGWLPPAQPYISVSSAQTASFTTPAAKRSPTTGSPSSAFDFDCPTGTVVENSCWQTFAAESTAVLSCR